MRHLMLRSNWPVLLVALMGAALPVFAQPVAYIAGQQGTISAVNMVTNSVVASFSLSGSPAGLAVSPNGAYLYVALQAGNAVAVVSTNTNTLVNTIPVGSGPVQIAVNPAGTAAYVVNQRSNNVSVINLATGAVTATIPVGARPTGIMITPDGSKAVVMNVSASTIAVIDTSTNAVSTTWQGRLGTRCAAATPDGRTLYAANQYYNKVSVLDAASGNVLNTISGFAFPDSVVVSKDGTSVYVANGNSKTVSVIAAATGTIVATIPVGNLPYDMDISPDGSKIYVANIYDATVSVISTATNTVTATIAGVGPYPGAVAVSAIASGGVTVPAMPILPQAAVDAAFPVVTGQSIAVHAGGDFQGALNSANCGDEIVLDAGATFSGNFNAPAKSCTGKVLVRSSLLSSLPAGVRVQQSQASLMPAVVTPNTMSALGFSPGSSGYYFAGINFTVKTGVQGLWNLITLSVGATDPSQLPKNIVFDRVLVHGNDQMCVRGFIADAAGFGLLNSQVYDFIHNSQDTQAILAYNSPGPFLILNNYLEATGENIMFGGADPTIANVIPSDATIRLNYLNKLFSAWNGQPQPGPLYDVKNTFEIKNGQRVLLDSNVFSYSWGQGQGGSFIVLTPRAQCYNYTNPLPPQGNAYCTAPWAVANDVTVVNNLFQHAGSMFFADGVDGCTPPGTLYGQSDRVLFRNNLGTDLTSATYAGGGQLGGLSNTTNWTIDHNTSINMPKTNNGIFFGDPPPSTNLGFTFSNNILYGPLQANAMSPIMVFQAFPSGSNLTYDIMVGDTTNPTMYPASAHFYPLVQGPSCNYQNYNLSTCWAVNFALVGFVDFNGGNYALAPTSPFHNAAGDGSDIGANVVSVQYLTAGVAQ